MGRFLSPFAFGACTYDVLSLELALGRMLKVHQRWQAVTESLQARKASQRETSSISSTIEALESLVRRAIVTLLSMEVVAFKEDAKALTEMIGVYGQGFLFRK